MSGKTSFGDTDELNPFADPYVALAGSEKKDAPVNPSFMQPSQQQGLPLSASNMKSADYPTAISASTVQPVAAGPTPFLSKPFSAEPQSAQGITPIFPSQISASYATPLQGQPSSLQDDLDRKAAELDRKEQELNRIQKNSIKANNFPPLPPCCSIQPCYYHDIGVEIPVANQKCCKLMFYLWQFYVLTLIMNFISSLALLVGVGGDSAATTFGVALIYMVIFSPCSFVCWYRPIYKALRDDSSFNYMVFFFIFFCQTGLTIVYAIGIPKFGTCGWINGISEAGRGNKAVAALMFITAVMWTVLVFAMIFFLKKIHSSYRNSGASFEKAQGEFASGIASNKAVQNVAVESVRAGMSGGKR